ncbi:MAG: hypothetical protein IPL39_15255 [Opitutaceae bacterium]|nr:hypothetical protein [Opitutaceae bacterium]
MRVPLRPHFLLGSIIPLAALVFMIWAHWRRAERVQHVSATKSWSVDAPRTDVQSRTGWEAGRRHLVLTQPYAEGHGWIAQAQQMLAAGDLRARRAEDDNAPYGRPALAASAYRWWLGALAGCDGVLTDVPVGWAVERTVLYANPLLQVVLLLGTLPYVVRRFGYAAGAWWALGVAGLYPMAGSFAPGLPGARGLALGCVLWSLLPLVVVVLRPMREGGGASGGGLIRPVRGAFVVAGLAGALGLWVDASLQVPALGGAALGALGAALASRKSGDEGAVFAAAGWRTWGRTLGLGGLVLYLIDYFPGEGLALEVLNPFYACAAWGLGEVLGFALPWAAGRGRPAGWRAMVGLVAGAMALAAVPVALMMGDSAGCFAAELSSDRLCDLPGSIAAPSLSHGLIHLRLAPFGAAALPVVGLGLAGVVLWYWRGGAARRPALALLAGPAVVFAGMACVQLAHCNALDAVVVLAGLALVATPRADAVEGRRWLGVLAGLALLVPGIGLLAPGARQQSDAELTDIEMQGILERDLAQWLSTRASDGQAIVLTAPDLAAALSHYGGLRVVNSLAWENKDGFSGAVRIARSSTAEEALALIQQRGLTHLVLPSWNRLLDDFISLRSPTGEGSPVLPDCFLSRLRRWDLPAWLQPLTYHIPESALYPGEFVMVLAVVEEQEEPLAVARLAEYFAENAMREPAASVVEELKQFPGDAGALAALAQVQRMLGDTAGLNATLGAIEVLLAAGAEQGAAWDRRFSLAVSLVLARRNDRAQPLFAACFAELDEAKLRSLSPSALIRFLALAKLFKLEQGDARLKALAPSLLPPALRGRL